MDDKDQSFTIEPNDGGKGNDLGKGYQRDIEKSSLPDFQYTPPTPSTPPAKDGNSGSSSSEG